MPKITDKNHRLYRDRVFRAENVILELDHTLRRVVFEVIGGNHKLFVPLTNNPFSYLAAHIMWRIMPGNCRFVYLSGIYEKEIDEDLNALAKLMEEHFGEQFELIYAPENCEPLINFLNTIECETSFDVQMMRDSIVTSYLHSIFIKDKPIIVNPIDMIFGFINTCYEESKLTIYPLRFLCLFEIILIAEEIGVEKDEIDAVMCAYEHSAFIKAFKETYDVEDPIKTGKEFRHPISFEGLRQMYPKLYCSQPNGTIWTRYHTMYRED